MPKKPGKKRFALTKEDFKVIYAMMYSNKKQNRLVTGHTRSNAEVDELWRIKGWDEPTKNEK